MTISRCALLLGAASVALSGCTTHLEVSRATPESPATRQGIAYFLPFTQYETKTVWSLSCDASKTAALAAKVTSTPKTGPDPANVYTIDYASLDALNKTSSVKVDFYPSGAIKSINAAADDRTAEIAAKAISAVGKIAKFAAAAGPSFTPICKDEQIQALKAIGATRTSIAKLMARLALEIAALDAMTARVIRGGTSTTDATRSDHDRLIGRVSATQFELDVAKKKLAGQLEGVTFTKTSLFPETSSQFASTIGEQVPVDTLRDWFTAGTDAELKTVAENFAVFLDLSTPNNWQNGKAIEETNKGDDKAIRRAGVRYRIAVPGTLSICQGAPCSVRSSIKQELATEPVRVLQQGTTFYLPFDSKAFTNGSLTATFSEDGVLTSAGYEQKRAALESVAGLADLLADQVVTVGGAIRDAKTTELERLKDEIDLAKARADLATAQKALDTQPKPANADQLAALAGDTALKQAELADLQADIAVRKARAERDGLAGGQ